MDCWDERVLAWLNGRVELLHERGVIEFVREIASTAWVRNVNHRHDEALGDTPTVSFLRRNGDRMRVFGESSFTGSVAADAGLRRPETQSFTDKTSQDIGAEQLEQADADWIFYGVQGGDDAALTGQPLWQTLGAVGAGQAVSVDDDVFYLNTGPTAARDVLDKLEDTLA